MRGALRSISRSRWPPPDYVPAVKRRSELRRAAGVYLIGWGEAEPDYPAAYFRIGRLLVKQGELDEAIAQFRRALTLSPEFVAARKALASTLLRQGRVDDSVREYEELVRLVPDSPTARRGLERARAVAALRARARRRS